VTLNVGLEGVSQSANAARTVYPAFEGVTYTATFAPNPKNDANAHDPLELKAGANPVELNIGDYNITVTATKLIGETDTVIATSAQLVKVDRNADANPVFTMKPTTGATLNGTFSYDITVPAGLETGKLTITPASGAAQEVLLKDGEELNFKAELPLLAGVYQLAVLLERGTGTAVEYAGFNESLHVYADLTSELVSVFEDKAFSKPVTAPIALDTVLAFAPVTNENVLFAIPATAEYDGKIVWTQGGTEIKDDPKATEKFTGELVYTATVTLTAKDGFTFTGIKDDGETKAFTYADVDAENVTYDALGNGSTIDITVVFKATEAVPVAQAQTVLTTLFAKPAPTGTPVKEVADLPAREYSVGTIEWDGDLTGDKFDGGIIYTAKVPLTAKLGFTFAEFGEDAFTYAGSTSATAGEVTEEGKKVTVTIVFPVTTQSEAQKLLVNLGLGDKAKVTGLKEVTVEADAEISGKTVLADVTLLVGNAVKLTVNGVLTVNGTLDAGGGTLVVGTGGKFSTGTAGSVVVKDLANLNTVLGAAGTALAVTVTGDTVTLAEPTVVGIGVTLTAAGRLTVANTISGTVKTTGDAGSVVALASTEEEINSANFDWAVKQAGIAKLEVTKPVVLGVTPVNIGATTAVTVASGGGTLTVGDGGLTVGGTLYVLGTLAGAGTLATTGDGVVNLAYATNNPANFAWAVEQAETLNLAVTANTALAAGTSPIVKENTVVTVATGAKLTVPSDGPLTVAGTLNVAGSLSVAGTGSLKVTTGSAVIGAGTDTVTLTNATVTLAEGTGAPAGKLAIADTGELTLEAETSSIAAAGTGSIVIGAATDTVTLKKATLKAGSSIAASALTFANTGSPVTIEADGTIALAGSGSVVIGATDNKVTLDKVTLGGGSLTDGALTLGNGLVFGGGSIVATGTNSIVVGDATNNVTLVGATLDGGTVAGSVLTLANGKKLNIADKGTITVLGPNAKLALVNAEFGAGTYTATGALEITSLNGGDTIKTAAVESNGLILGAEETALGLLAKSTTAANYTISGKVVFGNGVTAVTVPASAIITADANAAITLGTEDNATDAIGLKQNGKLVLGVGATLGAFTGDGKTLTPSTANNGTIGGAKVTGDSAATSVNGGVLTVSGGTLTLTGQAGNADSITADAEITTAQ
jgi:hypothetical protein